MWLLRLNPMAANAERVIPVAVSKTKTALEDLLTRERVEPYSDGQFRKVFKEGGPLEWFNPPSVDGEAWINVPALIDIGTEEDAAAAAREHYRQFIASVTLV